MDKRLKKYFPDSLCFEGKAKPMLLINGPWPELVRVIEENPQDSQLLVDKGNVPFRYSTEWLPTNRLAPLEEKQQAYLEALEPLMNLKAELDRLNENVGKKLDRQFRVEMSSGHACPIDFPDEIPF